MTKLNINQWAEEDRPREKLMRLGAEGLSNAELLAILIGSGSTTESAVDLMKRLLSECGNNLNTLGKKSISDLMEYKGIGEAKAITIFADSALKNRSLRVGLLSVPAAFVQLMGYGMGFLEAWWKRCVKKGDEFSAFERNFYK